MRTGVRLRSVPGASRATAAATAVEEASGWRVDGALAAVPELLPGVRRASDLAPPADTGTSALPVGDELAGLLPRGLRRGSVVAIAEGAPGMTTLLLQLLAAPADAGAWCAIVGDPQISALAVQESGINPARLPMVPEVGDHLAEVVSALLDGLDVIAVHAPRGLTVAQARRLGAKARKVGGILIPYGAPPERTARADVTLRVAASQWRGLGKGRGRLRSRVLQVEAHDRGRPRRAELALGVPLIEQPPAPMPPVVSLADRRRLADRPAWTVHSARSGDRADTTGDVG